MQRTSIFFFNMALCVYFEHRFGIGKILHSVEVALHDEAERVSVVKRRLLCCCCSCGWERAAWAFTFSRVWERRQRRQDDDYLMCCWFTWRDLLSFLSLSLFLCVRIYVCKYVKCVRSFSFLCMYVCTKCCRGPLVQYISFWFLALLSSVCNITRCSCSDQTLWLLPLLLLYIRSGDSSEDRGNDTTLTDSLFTYVCMYLYV